MELGHAILVDKLKQSKAENARLLQEIDNLKARMTNATQDYVSAATATTMDDCLDVYTFSPRWFCMAYAG